MALIKRYVILISGLLVFMLQFAFLNSYSQNRTTDFEKMKGTRFTHQIDDKTDSLSSREIIELRDNEGIPVWFSRDIFKNVCLTGECRIVRLRIYWNGVGNYLGFLISPNFPLTKTNHSDFSQEDYQKIDLILSDSLSILRSLKLKDLIVEKGEDKFNNKVDAHSGATQPSIYEYVVRNAVYTCYTLWHTVYGPARKNILSILDQLTDKDYLQKLFERKDPQYLIWAINFIYRHPDYHQTFYPDIIKLIKSEDNNLSKKALNYFTSDRLRDKSVQYDLARAIGDASSQNKIEIIRKFSELHNISNDAILMLMEHYENQRINARQLGCVYKLINDENLKDPRIVKNLKKF